MEVVVDVVAGEVVVVENNFVVVSCVVVEVFETTVGGFINTPI